MPTLWEIAAVLLIASIATAPIVVVLESYAMRVVPDEYVGREAAVSRFAVSYERLHFSALFKENCKR